MDVLGVLVFAVFAVLLVSVSAMMWSSLSVKEGFFALNDLGKKVADPVTCVHGKTGYAFSSELLIKDPSATDGSSCLVNGTALGLLTDPETCSLAPDSPDAAWTNLLSSSGCATGSACSRAVKQRGGATLVPLEFAAGKRCSLAFKRDVTRDALEAFDKALAANAAAFSSASQIAQLKGQVSTRDETISGLNNQLVPLVSAMGVTTTTIYPVKKFGSTVDAASAGWAPAVNVPYADVSKHPTASAFFGNAGSVSVPDGQTFLAYPTPVWPTSSFGSAGSSGSPTPGTSDGSALPTAVKWVVVGPAMGQVPPSGWGTSGVATVQVSQTGTVTLFGQCGFGPGAGVKLSKGTYNAATSMSSIGSILVTPGMTVTIDTGAPTKTVVIATAPCVALTNVKSVEVVPADYPPAPPPAVVVDTVVTAAAAVSYTYATSLGIRKDNWFDMMTVGRINPGYFTNFYDFDPARQSTVPDDRKTWTLTVGYHNWNGNFLYYNAPLEKEPFVMSFNMKMGPRGAMWLFFGEDSTSYLANPGALGTPRGGTRLVFIFHSDSIPGDMRDKGVTTGGVYLVNKNGITKKVTIADQPIDRNVDYYSKDGLKPFRLEYTPSSTRTWAITWGQQQQTLVIDDPNAGASTTAESERLFGVGMVVNNQSSDGVIQAVSIASPTTTP